jgi:transposase
MAYSEDYRRRAVEYYHEGHTQAEVKEVFKIHPKTLRDWEFRMENGNLKPLYPDTRKPRKLPPDKLADYVEQNPDDFLKEIGSHFGASDVAVGKALRRLKITRKKRHLDT